MESNSYKSEIFHTDMVADLPIEFLGLSNRAYNVLKKHAINTYGDLSGMTLPDLTALKKMGQISALEIIDKMSAANIKECYAHYLAEKARKEFFSSNPASVNNVRCTLKDYIGSLREQDPKKAEIFTLRLSGVTLKEIGDRFSLTRERVRQIVNSLVEKGKKPLLYEDVQFSYWYETYDISKDRFLMLFNTEESVFAYMQLAYKPGDKDFGDIWSDEKLTDGLRAKLEKICSIDKICLYGEWVYKRKNDLVKALFRRKHALLPCPIRVFYWEYQNFCKDNGLEDYAYNADNYQEGIRQMESFLDRQNYVLFSQGHQARYYCIDDKDAKELIEALDFKKYYGYVISVVKLYEENIDLMAKYNILSRYELHNVLKRHQDMLPDYVNCIRMPLLELGPVDREKQVKDFLESAGYVSKAQFARMFEKEYGVRANSFLSDWGVDKYNDVFLEGRSKRDMDMEK